MAWLSGYTYRKLKPVNATAAGAQTLYQVKLLVGESAGAVGEEIDCEIHCSNFPNDIRFTDTDGITKHDYWIESISGTTPNRLATIWIEVATIPAAGSVDLYMYYGKAADAGDSDGDATFLLHDNFLASLDWVTKWQSNNHELYSVSGGNLVLMEGGIDYTKCFNSKNSFSGGYAIETRQKVVGIAPCEQYLASEQSPATITFKEQTSIRTGDTIVAYVGGEFNTAGTGVSGTWYRSKITIPASGTAGTYFYSDAGNLIVSKTGTPTYTTGYLALHQRPSNTGYLDWVFVRKHVSPEPTWGTSGLEEEEEGTFIPLIMAYYNRMRK